MIFFQSTGDSGQNTDSSHQEQQQNALLSVIGKMLSSQNGEITTLEVSAEVSQEEAEKKEEQARAQRVEKGSRMVTSLGAATATPRTKLVQTARPCFRPQSVACALSSVRCTAWSV